MIRIVCDSCDKAIGLEFGDWFGVDHVKLDDNGELIEPGSDSQFHFCSPDCLVSWAMERSYHPSEGSA